MYDHEKKTRTKYERQWPNLLGRDVALGEYFLKNAMKF